MPRFPVTRARTAYLPLMLQLAGITRFSGNKASRISRSRSARHAAPSKVVFGAGLVRLEATAGGSFDIQGKAVANQQLAETGWIALDLADAEMPFLVGGIRAEIVAADLLAAEQFAQLIARLDSTGPHVSVLVDAELVDGRDIDAVEPVGDIAQLKRAAIPDDGGGGRTLAGRKYDR